MATNMGQLERHLREMASEDASVGMKPFLADRVMRRIASERAARTQQEDVWQSLVWIFRPAAALCLVLVLFLTIHNLYLSSQYETQGSMIDAVLALPEVNTVAAYQLDLTSYDQPTLQ